MVDVGVFVGCVRRRRLLEMKSSSLSIIRQMKRSETRTECIRAIVKARDSSPQVKMVHCVKKQNVCIYYIVYYKGYFERCLSESNSQLPPISVSMRSRLLWRSLCTMKSSRERMRKDEMQLTISLIPLAIESNRLFPSVEKTND